MVASTPEEYAQAVLRILDDPAKRKQLSSAGRERMLSHPAWDHSMQRLDGIIERCLTAYGERSAVAAPADAGTRVRAAGGT
jgi:glycosyltransferase involved in cell wall biosynthesis